MATSHLPADIREAIGRYDQDVAAGRIRFAGGEFASSYPGEGESDAELAEFVESKLPVIGYGSPGLPGVIATDLTN